MKHKTMKLSMSYAMLVVAMISLAGVGFAIAYQGSATTHVNPHGGEAVTVDADSDGFAGGIFTLDSVNDGTYFNLSNLQRWDSVDDTTGDTVPLSTVNFAYNDGVFSIVNVASGYKSAVIGSITVTIQQTEGAQAGTVTLTTEGAESAVVNQYGMSLVYTYKVNDGTETVANPNIEQEVMLTNGTGTVVLTAYLVYSEAVPVDSQSAISAFALDSANVLFTARVTE